MKHEFTTIRVEGTILPPDLLQRIASGSKDLEGLTAEPYHLDPSQKLNEAINSAWSRLQGRWATFAGGVQGLAANDTGATLTRERWMLPLLQELGYGRLPAAKAVEIDGVTYPVSHAYGRVPIHLVGCTVDLDKRTAGVAGAARCSPHSMLQDLLNRSEERLWGFLSNGFRLRILRDNTSLTRQAYVEFDLQSMMEGEVYSDFVLLYLLCHQSRVEGDRPEEFWLEKWSRAARDQGIRALDDLRNGVQEAITALGHGFLAHPENTRLLQRLRSGALDTQDYYRQILRLVYRLLFLFVAEDRDLLLSPDAEPVTRKRYTAYYSTQRLRALAGRKRGGRHADLFHALRLVMAKLADPAGCPELGLPCLGGMLFSAQATADLQDCEIANTDLLSAVRALAFTLQNGALRAVDYKNLGSEELGSVYESLLELHPQLNVDAHTFALATAAGSERKTTGSYYTPTGLIQCLLDSALDPVLDDRLKQAGELASKERASRGREIYEHKLVSRSDGLAESDGYGRALLSNDQAVSQGRALRDDIPDTPIGDVYPSQHSGGMGSRDDGRIRSVPSNSTGKYQGAGDTHSSLPPGEPVDQGRGGARSRSAGGSIEDDDFPHWFFEAQAKVGPHSLVPYSLLAEQRLLALRVCDPACGSGHFLIAAAHRIAKRLAALRSGVDEPSPEALRVALREVIGRCIYGVDLNPMAVELCKVALWMEALEPGKPLTFLDHRIRCGNSLLGTTPELMAAGIPDDAFSPVTGDDKVVAKLVKKRNREERRAEEGQAMQGSLDYPEWLPKLGHLAQEYHGIEDLPEETSADAEVKGRSYGEYLKSSEYRLAKLAADAWCAAFFWPLTEKDHVYPTNQVFRKMEASPQAYETDPLGIDVHRIAERNRFFHWEVEFPTVFGASSPEILSHSPLATHRAPGFDVVLGNPPWERIKLQEQEFFATRAPEIAQAPNKAARERLIHALKDNNPTLLAEFENAKHDAEAQSKIVRRGGRFPLCGVGDVNTYALFAELFKDLTAGHGRAGLICPTGIATDDTTKAFFGELTASGRLAGLFDFENRAGLFPAVDSRMKFCLLTIAGSRTPAGEFAFFLTDTGQLRDPVRRFRLGSGDFALLNPNTRTCPIFRTRQDAELTKAIYQRVPILVREDGQGVSESASQGASENADLTLTRSLPHSLTPSPNPWGVGFLRMFDMSNDSGLFRTREQLEAEGWVLKGNVFEKEVE